MKQRLISAMVGLIILFSALGMFETIVPNIAIALISAAGVWELLHAASCTKASKSICAFALVFAAAIPFLSYVYATRLLVLICYGYILALFITLLRTHNRLHVRDMAMAFMFSLTVPFSLVTLIYMRDYYGVWIGLFYALLTFGSAWLSDTGAYFAGRLFGKHKLAPHISPKKTVEGAIGGAVFSMITVPLVLWIYSLIATHLLGAPQFTIRYLPLVLLMPILSGLSILGDLSASIIKRQYQVKDFGSIMPGHGGVMDRFDSVLMVAPMVYIISRMLPLVQNG